MSKKTLTFPDLGGVDEAEVIEVLINVGDKVEQEQPILVLESDKASMEVPAEVSGVFESITVKVGDKIKQGDEIGVIEQGASSSDDADKTDASADTQPQKAATPEESAPAQSTQAENIVLNVPDLGGVSEAEVIEVLISQGDKVEKEQPILVLESDKASMELPAEQSGTVVEFSIKVGDKLKQGDALLTLSPTGSAAASNSASVASKPSSPAPVNSPAATSKPQTKSVSTEQSLSDIEHRKNKVHAGPSVRKLAREFGVSLTEVEPSGPKGRIVKEDIQEFVKQRVKGVANASGSGIPAPPVIDFSQFGSVKEVPLNNIKKATAKAMTMASLNVPQVTQFDLADITELEAFRKQQNQAYAKKNIKFTLVPFVMKALAKCLQDYPSFNASLSEDGEHLIMKEYVNIGVAVDTPKGLLVPVMKGIDSASIIEINQQVNDKAELARQGKLPLSDMQGGCISLSSLGGIGGTAFTPIVNPPEVAILGLSRSSMQPVWNGSEFKPRLMLPLSLSYDHRVIDGAEAARFTRALAGYLEDMRTLIM